MTGGREVAWGRDHQASAWERDCWTVTGRVPSRGRDPEGTCERTVWVEPCPEQKDEAVTEECGGGSRRRDHRDPGRVVESPGARSDVSWPAGAARSGQLEDKICRPD